MMRSMLSRSAQRVYVGFGFRGLGAQGFRGSGCRDFRF